MGFLRLFLALIVAGDHFCIVVVNGNGFGPCNMSQWTWLHGGYAVILFYAISGFLISYALAHKYRPTADGTRAFYRSRFVRIFSLYWPMLLIVGVLLFHAEPRPHSVLDWLVSIFIVGGDWMAAFANYPGAYSPYFGALGPVWSVAAELTFYAMAPFVLRSLPWTLCLFIASLTIRTVLHFVYGSQLAWTYFFFPSTLWCFLAGDLARRMFDAWLRDYRWVGPIMFAVAVVSLRLGGWTVPWLMVLSTAMVLPFLFAVTKDNRLLNFLGDLTYPIYLIHGTVFTFLFMPFAVYFLRHPDYLGIPSAPLFVVVYFGSLLILGTAVHFAIERPFAAVLRRLTAPAVVRLPSQALSALSPSAGRRPQALGEGAEV